MDLNSYLTHKFNVLKYLARTLINRVIFSLFRINPLKSLAYIRLNTKIRKVKADLIILDPLSPDEHASTWRTEEYSTYLQKIPKSIVVNSTPLIKSIGNFTFFQKHSLMKKNEFLRRKNSYLKYNSSHDKSIDWFKYFCKYDGKLAYFLFISNASTLLPWLEKEKLPFVFTLYPGGGFNPCLESTVNELKKICSSEMFRGVIVTQNFTKQYLIDYEICPNDRIKMIYGGLTQFRPDNTLKKMKYLVDKDTFDISFVAHKYTPRGRQKGFDIFIEVADILTKKYQNIHFHILGDWSDEMNGYEDNPNIHTYGVKDTDFFSQLASFTDISLSPNRSFKTLKKYLPEGSYVSFDGFPGGLELGMYGPLIMCTDDLNNADGYFKDGEDIVLINHCVNDICKKIEHFYANTHELYEISLKQNKNLHKIYSTENQMKERIEMLTKIINS